MNNLALDIFNKFMAVSHEFDIPQDDFIRLATYAAEAAEDTLFSDDLIELLDENLSDLVGLLPSQEKVRLSLQMALGYTKEYQ